MKELLKDIGELISGFWKKHRAGVCLSCVFLIIVAVFISSNTGSNTGYSDSVTEGMDGMYNSIGSITTSKGQLSDSISFDKATVDESYDTMDSANTEETELISSKVNFGDKIIYKGNINVKTGNISETTEKVIETVEKYGGYVTNLDNESEVYTRIQVRVPSEKFNDIMEDKNIEKNNTVRKSISSEDVSLKYSDTQAKLETLKVKEERILGYFKQADDIDNLIRLESELQSVRYAIESTVKELNMMDSYVSYSEINYTISSRYSKPEDGAPFIERVKYTTTETMMSFKEMSIGLVLFAIRIVPLTIYLCVLYFIIKVIIRVRKKIKNRKNK